MTFTQQEQAWLKEHPEVRLGYTEAYEPNVIKDQNGNLSGFMIDIYNELEALTGIKVNIVLDKWPVAIEKYRDGVTDGLLVVATARAKESGSLYTNTISTTAPTIFARSDAPSKINSEKDLIGKKISVLKNTFVVEKALKPYQDQIEIVETDSALEMLKLVLEGKVDAAFGLSFHNFLIGKYFLSGIEPVYYASSLETKGVTAIRPDWPELVSIINKGLAEIGEGKLNQIHNKWLLPYSQTKVTLSESEKTWLAQKQTIRVRITDYPPFIILDKDDKPAGIAIDYLKLISERTGVGFEYYFSDKTFFQALDGLIKHQGPDIMPLIVKTPDREKSIIFTNEYINSPYMIFTRADNKQIVAHIDDLMHKKITLLRGAFFYKMMKRDYPDFSLMLYDNDIEAIEAVASGEADVYIGNMILASYLILNRAPYNLKLAAPTPFENQRFSMGVRNDWPELAGIIDKGLAGITPEEQAQIRNRYISIHYDHSDPAAIIKWVLITVAVRSGIVLLFFFWNRTLRKQVHKRTSALRESEEKYRVLFESFPLGITVTDKAGRILETNVEANQLLGIPQKEHKQRTIEGAEWSIIKPDGSPMSSDEYASVKALKHNCVIENLEMGVIRPDGGATWLNVTAAPIPLENYGVAITYGDITDRKKAEEKLRESEKQFRSLVETTKAIAWELDIETSLFNYISPRVYDITGYKPEMWVGFEFWTQRIHPDDRGWAVNFCQTETQQGKDHEFEYRMITGDGEIIWIRDICTVIMKGGKPALLRGFFLDITDRRQSEEALRQSQAILHAALESMTDAVFISDANGRFVEFNHAFAKFHRLEDKKECFEALEDWTNIIEVYLPDGTLAPLSMWAVPRALQGETGIGIEYTLRRKDTGETWIGSYNFAPIYNSAGEIAGSVVVGTDITKSKKDQEKILAITERLNLATRAAKLGIWDWDIKNDNLVWDDTMYRLYGLEPDEFPNIYEAWLNSTHPEDRAENDRISEEARRGKREYDAEFRIIRPDGEIRYIKALGQVLRDLDGEPIRMIGINYDITEKKEMEKRLQQAQKMESIGNLAGGIAHDFNNILFPVIGMSELLLDDLPQNCEQYGFAEAILRAGKRGSDLVKQILAFSRQSEHKLIPVRVQKVLKEVIKLTRSTIPSFIEMQHDIQQNCGPVMADPTHIHQISMNIITNAYHAVEKDGGKITIKLQETFLPADDLPDSTLEPKRCAVLSISDTGHGMAPDLMTRIFEPYFTTKRQGKGTGLGLSVVYGIVKEHKGDIKVFSEVGKGTTFNIYLPLMDKTYETVSVEKSKTDQTGNERILLVDDEEPIVRLEELMLQSLGYNVSSRISSVDALAAFKANSDNFDLVISDMTMPNMTGDQLAKELIAIRPDIPIIICTGFSEGIDKEKAEDAGIKGFLMKPVGKSDMARMVRKVLDEAKNMIQ